MRTQPLTILKPQVEIPGFTMCQRWHEIHCFIHRWLRGALTNTAKETN